MLLPKKKNGNVSIFLGRTNLDQFYKINKTKKTARGTTVAAFLSEFKESMFCSFELVASKRRR